MDLSLEHSGADQAIERADVSILVFMDLSLEL